MCLWEVQSGINHILRELRQTLIPIRELTQPLVLRGGSSSCSRLLAVAKRASRHPLDIIDMSVLWLSRPLVRSTFQSVQKRAVVPPCRGRGMASAANVDPDKLPLAGIRVVDMTRVLAGVSLPSISSAESYLCSDSKQPYCTQILGDLGYA